MDIMAEVAAAFISSDHCQPMVLRHPSPGILVFSHSLQLQYANRRALEELNSGQTTNESGSVALPARLLELRDHIRETLDDRLMADIEEPFEVSRAVSECGQRLLFRGFGQPNGSGSEARIIILLEDLKAAEPETSQQSHPRMSTVEPLADFRAAANS